MNLNNSKQTRYVKINERLKQARSEIIEKNLLNDCDHFIWMMHKHTIEITKKPWINYVILSHKWKCPLCKIDGLHLYLRERYNKIKKYKSFLLE
jgi:hypothetical protein